MTAYDTTSSASDVEDRGAPAPSSGHAHPVMYRAAAALAYDDLARATADLREQLRVMAAAAGATVDWNTLQVEGPVEISASSRACCFEWTATATVTEVCHDLRDAVLDAAVPSPPPTEAQVGLEDTSPLAVASRASAGIRPELDLDSRAG